MLMLGIAVSGQQPVLNQVLLVAADINNGALQQVGAPPDTGQGLPVSNLSNRVTIYYSKHDDVLPYSQIFFRAYHNPSYPDRLGLGGVPAAASCPTCALKSLDRNRCENGRRERLGNWRLQGLAQTCGVIR